jgi:uncharacterized repeat protein (TIGR01451 family)
MNYDCAVERRADNMSTTRLPWVAGAILLSCAFLCSGVGNGQEPSGAGTPSAVAIKAVAEVELRKFEHGREVSTLAPADRVASGDWLIYTLEVRNTAPRTIPAPTVIYAVPEHTEYVADSAVGPAAKISYSVDGGRSFDVPENLKVQEPGGAPHAAAASDYTHIRWQLKYGLKGNSVAFVRFRARMK